VTDTSESNQGSRENAERAYNLIMKDKEATELRHEAEVHLLALRIREGWDNPTSFQICAMRDMGSELLRRPDDRTRAAPVRELDHG